MILWNCCVLLIVSPPQDFGASGKRWPWHPEAEVVAEERPLWPAELRRCPARGARAASPQLCRCVLHPGRRAAAGPAGGCTGDLVEQQPLPERAAQRGDHWQLVGPGPGPRPKPANPEPGHGGHHGSPCPSKAPVETETPGPPGPAQRCHCHTLLYGSTRRWRQPRFSRAAVHPVIIGVPPDDSPDIMWSIYSFLLMLGERLGCFVRDFFEASLSSTLSVILSHTDT